MLWKWILYLPMGFLSFEAKPDDQPFKVMVKLSELLIRNSISI